MCKLYHVTEQCEFEEGMGNPAIIGDKQIYVEPAEYEGNDYKNVRPSEGSFWEVYAPQSPTDQQPAVVIDLTPPTIQPVSTNDVEVKGNVPSVKVEIRPKSTSAFETLYENASTSNSITIRKNVDAIRITLLGSPNDNSEKYRVQISVHACFEKTG